MVVWVELVGSAELVVRVVSEESVAREVPVARVGLAEQAA